MKQILILAAAVLLAVSCSQKKAPKVLVLYYSQTNTTKVVAEDIANALGADLEAILPVVPYEGDIPAVAARCAKDAAEGKLPELKPFTVDVNAYDVIFLGYPIWMGTYAPPVAAALEAVNLDGKKVVPFCLHLRQRRTGQQHEGPEGQAPECGDPAGLRRPRRPHRCSQGRGRLLPEGQRIPRR